MQVVKGDKQDVKDKTSFFQAYSGYHLNKNARKKNHEMK
jgi:hypothetical protein